MQNEETVFIDKNGVRVTNRLIIINNSTFVPSSVAGVTVDLEPVKGKSANFLLMIAFAIFTGMALSSYAKEKLTPFLFIALITAVLMVVFFQLWRKKPRKLINIVAAGGHNQVIASNDYKFIEEAIDAIHKAI